MPRRKFNFKHGTIVSRLKILKATDQRNNGSIVYQCQCLDCGRTNVYMSAANLRGRIKNQSQMGCGCVKQKEKLAPPKDIVGQKFGRLTPVKLIEKNGYKSMYDCVCDCHGKEGGPGKKTVSYNNLVNGHRKSCGCLTAASIARWNKQALEKTKKELVPGTTYNSAYSMREKLSKNSSTGVKGVSFVKNNKGEVIGYRTYIVKNGKQIYGGTFPTISEAAKVREELEETYFKPLLNELEDEPKSVNKGVATFKEKNGLKYQARKMSGGVMRYGKMHDDPQKAAEERKLLEKLYPDKKEAHKSGYHGVSIGYYRGKPYYRPHYYIEGANLVGKRYATAEEAHEARLETMEKYQKYIESGRKGVNPFEKTKKRQETTKLAKFIAKRMMELRSDSFKTQIAFAKAVGIPRYNINLYDNNGVLMPTDKIPLVAKTLSTSVDYLIGLSDDKTPYLNDGSSTFGEHLKYLKDENKLSHQDMAIIMGLKTESMITYFIRNQSLPILTGLKKLAEYFNLSADYLLGLTDTNAPDLKK